MFASFYILYKVMCISGGGQSYIGARGKTWKCRRKIEKWGAKKGFPSKFECLVCLYLCPPPCISIDREQFTLKKYQCKWWTSIYLFSVSSSFFAWCFRWCLATNTDILFAFDLWHAWTQSPKIYLDYWNYVCYETSCNLIFRPVYAKFYII